MAAVLEDIYVQEMDRATSRLETVRINPTRQFLDVPLKEDGHWAGTPALYTWQNGSWFDTGGNEMDPADVPAKFRQQIEDHPVTVLTHAPAVTAVCKFCGEKMNQSEMEQHLIKHVTDNMAQIGAPPSSTPPKAKNDANQHARG